MPPRRVVVVGAAQPQQQPRVQEKETQTQNDTTLLQSRVEQLEKDKDALIRRLDHLQTQVEALYKRGRDDADEVLAQQTQFTESLSPE